jgi:hypothetical protein
MQNLQGTQKIQPPKNSMKKWAHELIREFSKEEANKYMKKHSLPCL